MGRRRKRTHNQMKHRNRKKPKINAAGDPSPDPNPNPNPPRPCCDPQPEDLASSSNFRNWADLPEPLLAWISYRLSSSAPDLLAFSAVCLPWRSAAAATASSSARGPPLLLNPSLCLHHRRPVRWAGLPCCRLQTLTLDAPTRYYHSPLSPQTLAKSCVGCSHGQLIFSAGRHAILADPFTGRELRSPNFPSRSFHFSFGILTAPVSSPSCLVLMVALHVKLDVHSILCWRPGSGSVEWSDLRLMNSPDIMSLVVFKGEIFGLDALYRLIVVESVPEMSWRLLETQFSTAQFLYHHFCGNFGQHLVECDGELLAVLFVPTGKSCMPTTPKIEVYQLDSTRSWWLKKESLGDWCLFIDAVGRRPFACRDPTRWGGRKNCVYVAGPGYDSWSVFPLDGEAIDMTDDSPIRWCYMTLPKWPSPVWVYPRTVGVVRNANGSIFFLFPKSHRSSMRFASTSDHQFLTFLCPFGGGPRLCHGNALARVPTHTHT